MYDLLIGLGVMAVIEGLCLMFLPKGSLEIILKYLSKIGQDQRYLFGLITVAIGVGLVWLAKVMT